MAYHPDVWELSDRGLMHGCVLIARHRLFSVLKMTVWERSFVAECPTKFALHGSISWKQRKAAREILTKLVGELERRKELGEWIAEAKALQESGVAEAHDDDLRTTDPTAAGAAQPTARPRSGERYS